MPEEDTQTQDRVASIPTHHREENSSELSILMQKALGSDNSPNFTTEQVDELLSQKREIAGYIHKDKRQESWDKKFYLVCALLFVLLISGLVLWQSPESFAEVLGFLAGLFGGGVGGYGFASRKSS